MTGMRTKHHTKAVFCLFVRTSQFIFESSFNARKRTKRGLDKIKPSIGQRTESDTSQRYVFFTNRVLLCGFGFQICASKCEKPDVKKCLQSFHGCFFQRVPAVQLWGIRFPLTFPKRQFVSRQKSEIKRPTVLKGSKVFF